MTETINQRIRRFRLQKNYTQRELGELLGLKCSTYSQMERAGNINSDTIIKLCKIFDIDAITLLYGENHSKGDKVAENNKIRIKSYKLHSKKRP